MKPVASGNVLDKLFDTLSSQNCILTYDKRCLVPKTSHKEVMDPCTKTIAP